MCLIKCNKRFILAALPWWRTWKKGSLKKVKIKTWQKTPWKKLSSYILNKKEQMVSNLGMFMPSFYAHISQKRKKLFDLTVFFALLGSAHVQVVHKHIDEIDSITDGVKIQNGTAQLFLYLLVSSDKFHMTSINFSHCFPCHLKISLKFCQKFFYDYLISWETIQKILFNNKSYALLKV